MSDLDDESGDNRELAHRRRRVEDSSSDNDKDESFPQYRSLPPSS